MLSALKNFGVTFIISAVFFGIIAYFATGLVTNTVGDILDDENASLDNIINNEEVTPPDEIEPGIGNVTDEKIPMGESFNFLIAVNDYRPDIYNDYTPDVSYMYNTDWAAVSPTETIGCLSSDYREKGLASIVLVRIDKEKREVVYSYFSPDIRVYTTGGYRTLSEVYEQYGIDRITEHIYALTGLDIKYSLLINGYDIDDMYALLGGVTANVGSDIYTDGVYNTMQYETTIEHTEADGTKWTEHKPNTYLVGKGDVVLNADNMYTILSAKEHSSAELSVKESYTIEILRKYLTYLANLEEKQLRIVLSQLIMRESEWGNIEGLDYTAAETTPENVITSENEWNEEETSQKWVRETYEPDGAVVSTNYTMNDFDSVYEMIGAVTYFENKTVTYPVTYHSAKDDESEYFEANINSGISLYMDYRK